MIPVSNQIKSCTTEAVTFKEKTSIFYQDITKKQFHQKLKYHLISKLHNLIRI